MVGAEDGTLGVDDALVGGLRQVIPQPVAGVTAAAVGVGAVDAKQMTLGRKAGSRAGVQLTSEPVYEHNKLYH